MIYRKLNEPMYQLADRPSHRFIAPLTGIAILLGGLIYVFFRPSEPLFFEWLHAVGLDSLISLLRPHNPEAGTALPQWIIYSLPGALWAFAYSLIITGIWAYNLHPVKYFWLSTIPLLVLGFEILQLPGIIPGTFCLQDLALGILGSGSGAFVTIMFLKPTNHDNKKQ